MWIDPQEYIRLRTLDTVYRGEHQSLVEANNRLIAEIESLKKPGYVLVPEVPTIQMRLAMSDAVIKGRDGNDIYFAAIQAAKENQNEQQP